jgi:hypothetical protein
VDHRRRILEHLEKMEAEKPAPEPAPSDPQLKIPLIGEVRRPPEVSPPKRRARRTAKPSQPRLGEP